MGESEKMTMPMMKMWRKRVRKNPRPYTVHVDKKKEPLCCCATKAEAFEAIGEDTEHQLVVRRYTVVDGRSMTVAWDGVR